MRDISLQVGCNGLSHSLVVRLILCLGPEVVLRVGEDVQLGGAQQHVRLARAVHIQRPLRLLQDGGRQRLVRLGQCRGRGLVDGLRVVLGFHHGQDPGARQNKVLRVVDGLWQVFDSLADHVRHRRQTSVVRVGGL